MIASLAIALIWTSNIFEAVALASRAFAGYYLLQAITAAALASRVATGRRRTWLLALYGALAVVMLLILVFAVPVAG